MRKPYDKLLKAAEPDPNWNIILYLMKHHLRARMSPCLAGIIRRHSLRHRHAPHSQLIEVGDIHFDSAANQASPLSGAQPETGHRLYDYAIQVKALLADTFGLRSSSADSEDYYFGGSYSRADHTATRDHGEAGRNRS